MVWGIPTMTVRVTGFPYPYGNDWVVTLRPIAHGYILMVTAVIHACI